MFTPVTLPPGRLRLATRPSLTGSAPVMKRIGIVDVAALAASTDGSPPVAAITDTCRRTSTTLADLEGGGDSQISFSVTHGWSAFGGADHGWQDAELGRGAWTLSDAVSGSVGPQGAATNVSSLRVGADRSWRSQEHSADGGPACGW